MTKHIGMTVWLLMLCGVADHATERYTFDAAGRSVRVDRTWELRPAEGDTLDLIRGLARCGPDIFVTDTQNRVSRIDATATQATLRLFAAEDQGIGRPTALAADCDRGRLYVVNTGPKTVVTLDTRSGAVLKTQPFKRELYETRFAVLVEPDLLYIGGLWNADVPRALPDRDRESFFESTWIGERVSLTAGTVEPGLQPYEARCVAAGACVHADLDRIRDATSVAWVAAQGISTRLALYDAQGKRTALHDVRSPKFLRDGTELPVASSPAIYLRWQTRNSLIRQVFAFGGHLVTIHTLTELPPDWTHGQPTRIVPFMNVHALDGTGLVSDVQLPGLPVGRDDTHLYAIDYGPGGPRNGAERAALLRIPVKASADVVQ